jgi:AraC family transcriptional regulator, transcriptional activator of pobA
LNWQVWTLKHRHKIKNYLHPLNNTNENIKQFKLSPLAKSGVYVVNMQNQAREEHDISKPHRDNHYLLMLATNGYFNLNIDFEEIEFSKPTLRCFFPEQVHHII